MTEREEMDALGELLQQQIVGVEMHELMKGGRMLAWLCARPGYCDRGRWHAIVEVPVWQSDKDPWPRYYFDAERGKAEVLEYLKAKKIDVEGAEWRNVRR